MLMKMVMRRWVNRAEPKVRGFPKPVTTNGQPATFCSLLDDRAGDRSDRSGDSSDRSDRAGDRSDRA